MHCGFPRAACHRASASRLSARSGVRIARALWQQACQLVSCEQFSSELLQADCSCLALRRHPPPAAAEPAPGTVQCSGSSGPGCCDNSIRRGGAEVGLTVARLAVRHVARPAARRVSRPAARRVARNLNK
jgi:hypothetical protein